MSQNTELLDLQAETLSPDDDGYEESLLKVSALFRGFDEALTAFIEEHGYEGDLADTSAKAKFISQKFRQENMEPPRNLKGWFVPVKKLDRETVFQFCFAFGLGIEETNDYFRCVRYDRSFDCHTISEAVYYFCIRNGLSYSEAKSIIKRIPVPKKVKVLPNQDILYTGTIIEYLDGIDDSEKLIKYITDNISDFQYNNVTAIKYIQELWTEISKSEGLAVQEGRIIDRYNLFEDRRKKGDTDKRSKEVIEEEVRYQEAKIKPEDCVAATDGASTWTILSQIFGMLNYMESEYAVKYNRSLSAVLSRNALMPLNASYCFPSQHNIDRVLRGELGDHELMRKLLILLVFYTYWAKLIISKNDADYSAKRSDADRCLQTMNGRLLSAGYSKLYVGNPYDWLFMWSLNDEHPLRAFRSYMGEVFAFNG